MTTLLIILLVIAFVSGAPLYAIMLGGAAIGAFVSATPDHPFSSAFPGMVETAHGMGTGDQAQVLSTIPLFIYAGYLLAESKTADRLVRFANAMLGWFPGGLAIVTIGTCALFTVFTGASGVTIVALGGLLLPALIKQGYPERFSLGLIAGTGSVGLLFPPALPIFVYGTVYGLQKIDYHGEKWDTGRFLFAGIVPGIVLVSMLSAVAVTVAILKKLPRQKFDLRELGSSLVAALPELIIPFAVIGGLATGIALPSVAALTVLYVVLLEVVALRQIQVRVLWATSYEAMAMVGAIFIIIFCSTIFTNYLVSEKVPDAIVAWTREHVESRIVFLLAINGILLLVGTVMDIFSAIVIVLPLIAPIAHAYDINPYHLGVIFLLNLEVGYLHPPVGLNLFITSVKFRKPITEVMWATIPFLLTMIVALLTITYIPALTVVPDAPRTLPLHNLVGIVHDGAAEYRWPKEVTLALASGAPLKDEKGQPRVKKLAECESIESPTEQGKCKDLFRNVSDCRDKHDADCEKAAIGSWTVDNVEIITVKDVPLVDQGGKPVADATGQPIVLHLPDCAKFKAHPTDVDNCRKLFNNVSNCRNGGAGTEAPAQCEHEAIADWIVNNHDLAPEVANTVPEAVLIDDSGKPMKGKDGKPITLRYDDCLKTKADPASGGGLVSKDQCLDEFQKLSDCSIEWGTALGPDDCRHDAIPDFVRTLSE